MNNSVRPTKKQRELLVFIEGFVKDNGYSPSYREIMYGLDYTSVATVSLHINSLIRRGHLRKRDRSARSLEVVAGDVPDAVSTETPPSLASPAEAGPAWLIGQIEQRLARLEKADAPDAPSLHEAAAHLIKSLDILGHDAASRLAERLDRVTAHTAGPMRQHTNDRTE